MSCQGCQDSASETGTQTRAFDAAFARFWPEHQPFPPATPWLAAAVSRAEAKQWAVDVGADRDPGVLAGDMQAMLHVVGLAVSENGLFGKKKKKKKDKRPELPDDDFDTVPETRPVNDDCYTESCNGCHSSTGSCCRKVCPGGTTSECVECLLA